MPRVALDYEALPRQADFHTCAADEVLFGGAAGPGKSLALLMEFFHQAIEQPGVEVILFRRMFPQLENTLIKWSLEGAPGPKRPGRFPVGEYNGSRHTWYFPNGSRVRFGHAQHEQSIREYQGQQFEGIGFDELTEWLEPAYRFALRLLRTTNPSAWPRIRAASNPIGIGFDWVKARFVEPYLNGLVPKDEVFTPDPTEDDPEPMTRAYIPATHRDNPILTEADPGYLGRLRQLPRRERVALEQGSWDLPAFEGQLFPPDVLAAMADGVRGFEPARFRCGKCHLDWYDPTWVRVLPDKGRQVIVSGRREWPLEVVFNCTPRCKLCDAILTPRKYLSAWDVARKRNWVVGATVDVTESPAQLVRFERFQRVPWPRIATRIEERWALYPGTTYVDSTGVGDPLMQFLKVPVEGVLFSGKSKVNMVEALILVTENEMLKVPMHGDGVEQVYRELSVYQWDDEGLTQDCVMTLAMLALNVPRFGDLGITV